MKDLSVAEVWQRAGRSEFRRARKRILPARLRMCAAQRGI